MRLDLGFVGAFFRRHGLVLWFTAVTLALLSARLGDGDAIWFFDARLYVEATREWLAGGDPWLVTLGGDGFGAPPPTLLVIAPFAILPEPLGLVGLVASCVVGAVVTIRVLGLPWWWLLFPPLVEAVWSGNVQTWLIPLLLSPLAPAAIIAKYYAAVPLVLLGRWRPIAVALAATVVTIPVLPWATFIDDLPIVVGYFRDQSTYALPTLAVTAMVPMGALAMLAIGRRDASWMAVPAFGAVQWYYTTFVLVTRAPIAVAFAAVPVPGSGMLALIALGVQRVWARRASDDAGAVVSSG